MSNYFKITVFSICFFMLSSCSNKDMTSSNRIKNGSALKDIKKIALLSFSINQDCTISDGEDESHLDNKLEIKYWGKHHLSFLYDRVKSQKSLPILDLDKMIYSKKYQNLMLEQSYKSKKHESWPDWLSSDTYYMNTYDGFGITKLNQENSKNYCKALKTDAVLSMEVTYALNEGINIPVLGNFIKPNWTSSCKIKSKLYNSTGELVWEYEFKVDSPLKIKANKSLNLVLYYSSSITGKQTNTLFESVEKYSTDKFIEALNNDMKQDIN